MKSNYVVRAIKFLNQIVPYFDNYSTITEAVNAFNHERRRKVLLKSGAVRRVLLTSDYVIKWDYNENAACRFGGCEEELAMWKEIESSEFQDLFAEITPVFVRGKDYYIMPRVQKLAIDVQEELEIDSYLTDEAKDYIYDELMLHDIHDENWGFINGCPVIIDYACAG